MPEEETLGPLSTRGVMGHCPSEKKKLKSRAQKCYFHRYEHQKLRFLYQENASCVYKTFQMSSSFQLLVFPRLTYLYMLRRCLRMKNRVVMGDGSVIFSRFRFVHKN